MCQHKSIATKELFVAYVRWYALVTSLFSFEETSLRLRYSHILYMVFLLCRCHSLIDSQSAIALERTSWCVSTYFAETLVCILGASCHEQAASWRTTATIGQTRTAATISVFLGYTIRGAPSLKQQHTALDTQCLGVDGPPQQQRFLIGETTPPDHHAVGR